MSPAEARFRLVQGGSAAAARFEVLARIRSRWDVAAADEAQARVLAGTDQEAEAWLRRSAYFLDLAAMLDLSRHLPVRSFGIRGLLDLLAPGQVPPMSFLLLELPACPKDWRDATRSAPLAGGSPSRRARS